MNIRVELSPDLLNNQDYQQHNKQYPNERPNPHSSHHNHLQLFVNQGNLNRLADLLKRGLDS